MCRTRRSALCSPARACCARPSKRGWARRASFVAINNRVSQSVPHLHIHVVPRRRGDGLKGFFWPRGKYRDAAHAEAVRESIRTGSSAFATGRASVIGSSALLPQGSRARTFSLCSARNCRSLSRRAGRLLARMATASSAALRAPGAPMASVPTGIPAGICTVESSESRPLSAALSMGTPSTGRIVWAAHTPGQVRGAAGGRDDHLDPARFGLADVLGRFGRRAVRRKHPAFVRNAEIRQHLVGLAHHAPSPTCCP